MEGEGLQGARDPSNPALLIEWWGWETDPPSKTSTGQRNPKCQNTPGERGGKEGKRSDEEEAKA